MHAVNIIIVDKNAALAYEILRFQLIEAYSELQHRIDDEQVEILYKNLYSYDPSLRISFEKALKEIIKAEEFVFKAMLILLQEEISTIRYEDLDFFKCIKGKSGKYEQLGKLGKYDIYNGLNRIVYMQWYENNFIIEEIISSFRSSIESFDK